MRTIQTDIDAVITHRRWHHLVRVKHLFATENDAFSIGMSMNRIADVLEDDPWFAKFGMLENFRDEDDMESANALLDKLYDYCDAHGIWLS